MLRQLLYISTIRAPLDRATLDAILAVSRSHNARDGISGLLVVGRHRFLQLLEGDPMTVEASFQRIAADPRHQACVIVRDRMAERRQFADWAMGSVEVDEAAGPDGDALGALVAAIRDPSLRAQFDGFLAIQRAAA